MKKRVKRGILWSISLLCLISMTSCAQKEETLPTISFMAIALNDNVLKNQDSDKVIEKYEDYTGIHVEWQWVRNEVYDDNLLYVLQDKENIPMILTVGGSINGTILQEVKKGSFWDLSPYLADTERFPNLSQANKNILKAMTVDGQIIGIYRGRALGRYGMSYRKDWAEAVGITKDPESVEEVYDMLFRFTYNDPDGNGMDDTYGLELTGYTGCLKIIQTWFGCGNEWVEEGGELIPVHQTKEYRQALRWLRRIYEDGLVRPDWPLVDSGAFGNAVKTQEAGMIVDVIGYGTRAWNYFQENNIPSAANPNETAAMSLVGPVENATLATDGYRGMFLITTDGARTEEDVVNCLTFLDKMCDEEMMVLADYGLEGSGYRVTEDGYIEKINEQTDEKRPEDNLNQAIAYIPNYTVDYERFKLTEVLEAQRQAYNRNEQTAVYNPAFGYLAESKTNVEKGTELDNILDAAAVAYICCQISDSDLAAEFQRWEMHGGKNLIAEVNALYQEELGERQ